LRTTRVGWVSRWAGVGLVLAVCGGAGGQAGRVEQGQGAPGGAGAVAGQERLPAPAETPADGNRDTAGAIGDAERSAPTFTAYDLTVHLRPEAAGISVLARVTVRNDGARPMGEIAMQISSSLRWDGISGSRGGRSEKLPFNQHVLETDADHTGRATEAVVRLPEPLQPGAAIDLALLYSGAVLRSAARLERVLAPGARAARDGWDAIGAGGTMLRGYGEVLWYPTASPQVFAGEEANLTHALGQQMLRQRAATVRMRVSVEYTGEAPAAAFFCGRREPLKPASDNADAPIAEAPGIATAEFAGTQLGFRTPSLFVVNAPGVPAGAEAALVVSEAGGAGAGAGAAGAGESGVSATGAGDSASSSAASGVAGAGVAAAGVTGSGGVGSGRAGSGGAGDGGAALAERLARAVTPVAAMLDEWIGRGSAPVLTVVDHAGAAFGDGVLLVMPVTGVTEVGGAETEVASLQALLAPSLGHARFRSAQVWLDQGVPQFVQLLWMERTRGKPAALAALDEASHGLALAESGMGGATRGDGTKIGAAGAGGRAVDAGAVDAGTAGAGAGGLLTASEAVFYRTKAAAVLWSMRGMVGDEALKRALDRYAREPRWDRTADGFERVLEQVSEKDLRWFFDDWVYRDPGLPELSIVAVTPRELQSKTAAGAGWLVAVEVKNDGGAAAEVPVTVRSGALTATERIRVGAHSSASTRVLFQGVPAEVQVNDGSVPELIASTHVREIGPR